MMPHSGGATPSGQKTPRRVQWFDDTRAGVEPVHELDELGRDVSACGTRTFVDLLIS